MRITDLRDNSAVNLTDIEDTRVPWKRDIVVAFQGFGHALLTASREDVRLNGYYLGVYKGFVSGLLKQLPPPMQLFRTPEALLAGLFSDYIDTYKHSGHPMEHPLVHQIPDGVIGAGVLLVRNATELGYGRGILPVSNVERQAVIRSRAVLTLKELGFERSDGGVVTRSSPR
jgi:hypothetical protein